MNNITINNRNQFDELFAQYAKIRRRLDLADMKLETKLAGLAAKHQQDTATDRAQMEQLEQTIQQYAESNRAELTQNGKMQSVKLGSGCLKWRKKPASVQLNGDAETVLQELRRRKLSRFIRVKEEINKTAILSERDLFEKRPLDCIVILDNQETFSIEI